MLSIKHYDLIKSFPIITKESSEYAVGNYYSLTYSGKKKRFVTILFSADEEERIVIVDTDKKGNGWLYYCEII